MTIEDIRQIAVVRDGKCLSNEYKGDQVKLSWMCSRGHTWDATIEIIKQGGWCQQCLKEERKREALEKMQKIAKKRGGKCLSEKYENVNEKLKWQCNKGHEWFAKPAHIKNSGSWCPYCAGKAKRTIEQMKKLAEKRGGKCLSTTYKNINTKLTWKCSHGHQWEASPTKVLQGQWCPHYECRYKKVSEKLRLDIKDLYEIATDRGGELLSSEYINSHTPLKWQCAKGHQWTENVLNIKHNYSWCPVCYSTKKDKTEYKKFLREREKVKEID